MAGSLTISPFPAAVIDPGRDGDINWSMDPYDHPDWVLDFRWGEWIEALIEAYLNGGPHADAYRDRAEAILKSWIADVPIAARPGRPVPGLGVPRIDADDPRPCGRH